MSETSKKYNLSDLQLRHLAIICYREQGSIDSGVRACASHMCNYFEKYQTKNFKNVYECTFGSGWYWNKQKNEQWVASHPNVPTSVIDAVRDVICNGNRFFPDYVDEYDCLTDIKTASNNGVSFNPLDRKQYKSGVTKITNVYGSSYTFYCFPDGANGYCDAFGYINKNVAQSTAPSIAPLTAPSTPSTARTTAKLPEIQNGSVGAAVNVLQGILDLMGYVGKNGSPLDIDGEFGGNTAFALTNFQTAAELTADGVCGVKTWAKLRNGITY